MSHSDLAIEQHETRQSLLAALAQRQWEKFKSRRNFDVTIKATVTKTYTVEACCEDEAINLAHEMFSTAADDPEEIYTQDTLKCQLSHEDKELSQPPSE